MSNPLENLSSLALFNATADALLLADDTGHIVMANTPAQALLGYGAEEIVGLEVEQLMPQRNRARHGLLRQAFTKQPSPRPRWMGNDICALHSDGTELPVDISLSPLTINGHSFFLLTLYDTLLRRQMEEALRSSEERLRLAKHAAGLGIFDLDIALTKLYWDEQSRALWGFGADEDVTIEKLQSCVHPDDRAAHHEATQAAMDPEGSGEYKTEFRIARRNDAVERWMSVSGSMLFSADGTLRLAGIVKDITDQKRMEGKLQEQHASMELLLKQQVAMQTASAIAHELNQPLAAISAYGEALSHALAKNALDSARLRHALTGCATQSQHAGQILNELLTFLHTGELITEPIDLGDLVRETLGIMKHDGYDNLAPALQLETGLPRLLGNRLQLQKVLTNLLRNSAEAMHEAGVTPAIATISASTAPEKNRILISITDNGPGLAENTASRIFEPFFTTKNHGIGMGLAISRNLIESHGGRLWLDTDGGPGTTFHILLPGAP